MWRNFNLMPLWHAHTMSPTHIHTHTTEDASKAKKMRFCYCSWLLLCANDAIALFVAFWRPQQSVKDMSAAICATEHTYTHTHTYKPIHTSKVLVWVHSAYTFLMSALLLEIHVEKTNFRNSLLLPPAFVSATNTCSCTINEKNVRGKKYNGSSLR